MNKQLYSREVDLNYIFHTASINSWFGDYLNITGIYVASIINLVNEHYNEIDYMSNLGQLIYDLININSDDESYNVSLLKSNMKGDSLELKIFEDIQKEIQNCKLQGRLYLNKYLVEYLSDEESIAILKCLRHIFNSTRINKSSSFKPIDTALQYFRKEKLYYYLKDKYADNEKEMYNVISKLYKDMIRYLDGYNYSIGFENIYDFIEYEVANNYYTVPIDLSKILNESLFYNILNSNEETLIEFIVFCKMRDVNTALKNYKEYGEFKDLKIYDSDLIDITSKNIEQRFSSINELRSYAFIKLCSSSMFHEKYEEMEKAIKVSFILSQKADFETKMKLYEIMFENQSDPNYKELYRRYKQFDFSMKSKSSITSFLNRVKKERFYIENPDKRPAPSRKKKRNILMSDLMEFNNILREMNIELPKDKIEEFLKRLSNHSNDEYYYQITNDLKNENTINKINLN